MIITLLGMSGIGKTYWATQLEQTGFQRFSVDDYIESKLGKELSALGYSGINDVARWMGQPYEKRYPQTSQAYLNFERDGMVEALFSLRDYSDGQNDLVIDTTGSVINMPDKILHDLSKRTIMVYFHTPEAAHSDIAQQYLLDPKPVIWGQSFNQAHGETKLDAIARCYPELLRARTTKYKRLAQVTFDYDQLHSSTMTAQTIVDRAREVGRG